MRMPTRLGRMSTRPRASLWTTLCLIAFGPTPSASGQTPLEYQDRGAYYEGVKPFPVSAYDIELISALIDFKEPSDDLPEQLRVKFYLPSKSPVHLVVREQDNRLFYWLDRVKPVKEWRVGRHNEFAWPTMPVLRRLIPSVDAQDLGVLIRLGTPEPTAVETVAPALVYHAHSPEAINAYLFTMKTGGDARLSCSVYREGEATPRSTQTFRRIPGGRPLTVRWDTEGARAADFTLACKGFFLDTNQLVQQTVRFYHQPLVR